MKVIALLNPDSFNKQFLVQVSESELTNIVGERYGKKFNIGDQVDVAKIFDRLHSLDNHKGNVQHAMKQLRAMADLMESFDPVVRAVIEGEKEAIE